MRLIDAHQYSIHNMEELSKARLAGCYQCLAIFEPDKIKETTDAEETALCPQCGTDSVLSDLSPYKIDIETLTQLKKYWF